MPCALSNVSWEAHFANTHIDLHGASKDCRLDLVEESVLDSVKSKQGHNALHLSVYQVRVTYLPENLLHHLKALKSRDFNSKAHSLYQYSRK